MAFDGWVNAALDRPQKAQSQNAPLSDGYTLRNSTCMKKLRPLNRELPQ